MFIVYNLLMNIWEPAVQRAKEERAALQAIIDIEGGKFKLDSVK